MASYTLEQLAAHVGGRVIGDPKTEIRRAAGLEKAGAFDISFLANPKYARKMKTTRAAAVVVKEPSPSSASLLVSEDPYYAFTQIVVRIHGYRRHPIEGVSRKAAVAPTVVIGDGARIHDNVTIEPGARIGKNCVLYPGVYIGPETEIGDDCLFYPNVVVYDRCRIGSRVIIQANAVVGQDGFGFSTHNGVHYKIPHVGGVVIEDDVELGAGCAIERGALEDTVIGKGAKIGDLVVIGHGAQVGPYCLLVAQVGVAGSTVIGRHCVAGGQAGIAGHLTIGNQVMIGGQSGVGHDAGDGEKLLGSPAIDVNIAKRAYLMIRHLPEMARALRDLKKRMDLLESRSK